MLNDVKLWDDFRANKEYALSQIYINNVELLFSYGGKYTNDEEILKDTIQELFFDLIRTREHLGPTDNIRFYLIKSFKRKLLRELGSRKKMSSLEDSNIRDDITSDNLAGVNHSSIEEDLISNEISSCKKELILKALDKLSPRLQEILFYRYTCDFKYDQICDIMLIEYDSARKMIFRAIKSLKEYVHESDYIFHEH
ncbi:MAG: sigma-70 family RNA polymerase sigma factor [Bacteroidales bacterium]|nr:sigma-70 family RNA polymerase sigma factor [Bacteroidales bacterium]